MELTAKECADLVAPGGIGRVVFWSSRGPVALPVNYRVLDGDIIFRTSEDSILSAHDHDVEVSFEVDQIDDALTEGRSVLMTCFRKHVTSQRSSPRSKLSMSRRGPEARVTSSCDSCRASLPAGESDANEAFDFGHSRSRTATIEPHVVPVNSKRSEQWTETLKVSRSKPVE